MDQTNKHPQHTHNRESRHHDAISQRRASVNEQEGLDSVIANTGTRGSHAQAQIRNTSHGPSPHTAVPAVDISSTILQNAQGVTISGDPSFHTIGSVTNIYEGTDGLQNLNGFISFDAQFDSSAQDPDRKCHPGTRQNVQKRLRDWIDNPNLTQRIFWLYGPAGAGKSAIAQTIARSYSRQKVAASFFFSRSDASRNDGNRLFTTLAYQLGLSMPEIKEHIAHSLSERPDLPRTDVETQFDQLLARPFHVLSDNATQQLAPAIIVDIVKNYQESAPVIIIDGVDECTDERLQRRFLKIIGDAVKDDRFPLRFLIVSRPEVHVEQTIRPLQPPVLTIDLAELDDANRDIKKYLVDEFSRIAAEKDFEPTWPGQEIIDDIVYKSSGNFIYVSLVIRFVGDPDFFAKTQLEIVLNIKPPNTMSPFAILDQLFLEILRRVPHQEFLKRYLAILVARISVSGDYGLLSKDDAVLMHVSEQEFHVKLIRMRSLLKFQPVIGIYHRSFLDFLHDSSRSSEYYIREQGGIKGYLEVVVDSLVRYVSSAIDRPNHHATLHFTLMFREMVKWYPPKLVLPVEVWQQVIQPLLDLQPKLLQLPRLSPTWDILHCDRCTLFLLQRELLQLAILNGQRNIASVGEVRNLGKHRDVISSTTAKADLNMNDNGLDSLLRSLFSHLPESMENFYPHKEVITLMNAILCFDHADTVTRICSVSDAQKLVDLLDYIIHANNTLHDDTRRKAGFLALAIFARVPIIPLSYFLNGNVSHHYIWTSTAIHIEVLSQTIFANRILDRRYIFNHRVTDENELTMDEWRHDLITNSVTTIRIMLQLAKAIQYFHSTGIVLHQFHSRNVVLDTDFRPKIRCLYQTSRVLLDKQCKEWFSPEDNIFSFGCFLYEVFSGIDIFPDHPVSSRRGVIIKRPSPPVKEIPEYAWQLIQRCCAEDPTSRPSIDQVVKEIEGWHNVRDVEWDDMANEMQGRHSAGHLEPNHVANGMRTLHSVGDVEPDDVANRMPDRHGVPHPRPSWQGWFGLLSISRS